MKSPTSEEPMDAMDDSSLDPTGEPLHVREERILALDTEEGNDDGLGMASIPEDGAVVGSVHPREEEAPAIPDPSFMADVDIPEPLDDADDEEILNDEPNDGPVTAAKLCEHMEKAPDFVTLPEGALPVGTDIHVETKGTFVFKLPGQPAAIGRGRTIYGAMLNAGIIR